MKTYINIFILLMVAGLASACKKNAADPAPEAPVQQLSLKLTPMVGADTLKFNTSFTTENKLRYTLSSFRYYLSDICLVKADGSEHAIEGKVFLVHPNISDYPLGNVPVGDYTGIRFTVGLDSATNHADPTTYPIAHPLAIQSPAIHWDWNSGYIFLMLEGTCDTTVANTDVLTYGQYSHGLFFHIGMDPLVRNVALNNNAFSVSADAAKVLYVHSDINKLFAGIDLKTQNASHTMGTMSLATKVADNIPAMFTLSAY